MPQSAEKGNTLAEKGYGNASATPFGTDNGKARAFGEREQACRFFSDGREKSGQNRHCDMEGKSRFRK